MNLGQRKQVEVMSLDCKIHTSTHTISYARCLYRILEHHWTPPTYYTLIQGWGALQCTRQVVHAFLQWAVFAPHCCFPLFSLQHSQYIFYINLSTSKSIPSTFGLLFKITSSWYTCSKGVCFISYYWQFTFEIFEF